MLSVLALGEDSATVWPGVGTSGSKLTTLRASDQARQPTRSGRRRLGSTRPCALCRTPVYRSPSSGRHARFFCNAQHRHEWMRRPRVRCVTCGKERSRLLRPGEQLPGAWVCPACRRAPRRAVRCGYVGPGGRCPMRWRPGEPGQPPGRRFCSWAHYRSWRQVQAAGRRRSVRCAYDGKWFPLDRSVLLRRRWALKRAGRPLRHFCSPRHRARFFRRPPPEHACRSCRRPIPRKKDRRNLYCSRACAARGRRGSTYETRAFGRILDRMKTGTRGVRALARASGVTPKAVMRALRILGPFWDLGGGRFECLICGVKMEGRRRIAGHVRAHQAPKPIQHGTTAGYQAHRSRREEACASCKAANRRYNRERYVRRPPKPIAHGTPAGYSAHRRREEPACGACLEANARYWRERRASRGEAQRAYAREYMHEYRRKRRPRDASGERRAARN